MPLYKPLVAVDIGNNRLKAGFFPADRAVLIAQHKLPEPLTAVQLSCRPPIDFRPLAERFPTPVEQKPTWMLASVNPPAQQSLQRWLGEADRGDLQILENPGDLPLQVDLPRPEAVGIDRLLNAVAVNLLRPAGTPAMIVDAGSATTIDALSPQGTFLGGAILPGLSLAARALHQFTYWLPLVDLHAEGTSRPDQPIPGRCDAGKLPTALGTSTQEAMISGLFWGAVGAVREVIRRLAEQLQWTDPLLVLTGGDAPLLSRGLAMPARHLPHLTLQGIAVAVSRSDG